MDSYLNAQRENVFSDVEVLIYVFDIESRAVEQDLETYSQVIKALKEFSPNASVFCLVHKMDLIINEHRVPVYEERCRMIVARSEGMSLETFASSIWDQTLYRAWAGIVHKMVPNLIVIERYLEAFAHQVKAEEVVLFEKSTFLTVTHIVTQYGDDNSNADRHERISNIMKSYKHTAARNTNTTPASAGFLLFKIQSPRFHCFLARFTENTYIFVVVPPGEENFNCAVINMGLLREAFARHTGVEG
jgi:Ras-related GTP-binding protein A/B